MTTPQVQNDPIYNLAHPVYIEGLNISVASTTAIGIAPGQCRDSSNNIDMPVGYVNLEGGVYPAPFNSPAVTSNFYPAINPNGYGLPNYPLYPMGLYVSSAVNGVNGLDQGAIAASSFYCIYLIADSRNVNPTAGLLSLYSNAYPLMPNGYDSVRLIGFVQTDASKHFTSASVLNMKNARQFLLQPEVSVLAAGTATTFTAIDLSGAIPTTTDPFVVAILDVLFTPAAIGDVVQFRPTGSTATAGLVTVVGAAAGVPQQQYVQVICGVGASKPEVDYLVTSSSDAVTVLVNNYTYTTA